MPHRRAKQPATLLTATELLTLQAVAQTDTSKEAAAALGVAKRTVDFHLVNAFRKLGVSSKHRALLVAVREGVLTL